MTWHPFWVSALASSFKKLFFKTPNENLYQDCFTVSCINNQVVGLHICGIWCILTLAQVTGAVCSGKPTISSIAIPGIEISV